MQKNGTLNEIFQQTWPSFSIRREKMFVNTRQRWGHYRVYERCNNILD